MTTKLKCLLLDDELPGLTYLKLLCEQLPDLEVVKAFNSPVAFLAEMEGLDFDLCILDIEMPGMNGLQLANLLRGKPVIFTTAYREYAADAFDLDAIDYLRKPIRRERLEQAIAKAVNRILHLEVNKEFTQLNTDKGKTLLFFDQLSYIRTAAIDSRDKVVQLTDGSFLTLKNISFSSLEAVLPVNLFCRINKQEMIALKAVKFFRLDEITTNIPDASGKFMLLTLSETYRSSFLAKVKI